MTKIFLSYRRDDTQYAANQIRDQLAARFGREAVVFDIDSIPLAADFPTYIRESVAQCDILLALIGAQWLEEIDQRRNDPTDWVRIEVAEGLKQNKVLPVLIGGAKMPTESRLPPELSALPNKMATEVRAGRDLNSDLARVVSDVARLLTPASGEVTNELRPLRFSIDSDMVRVVREKEQIWQASSCYWRNLLSEREMALLTPDAEKSFGPSVAYYVEQCRKMQKFRRRSLWAFMAFWLGAVGFVASLQANYSEFYLNLSIFSAGLVVVSLIVSGAFQKPYGMRSIDVLGLTLLGPFRPKIHDHILRT
jgi:hypothetical protein